VIAKRSGDPSSAVAVPCGPATAEDRSPLRFAREDDGEPGERKKKKRRREKERKKKKSEEARGAIVRVPDADRVLRRARYDRDDPAGNVSRAARETLIALQASIRALCSL
jgi:hypothetical protein